MIIYGTTILHMGLSTAHDIADVRRDSTPEGEADRAALIMGSTGHIAPALAATLLEANWHVTAAFDDTAALFKLVEQLADPRGSRRFLPLIANLDTEKGCAGAVRATHAHFGRLDVLILPTPICAVAIQADTARGAAAAPLTTQPACVSVDLRGTVFAIQAVLPFFEAQKRGRILIVAHCDTSTRTPLHVGAALTALESICGAKAETLTSKDITINVLMLDDAAEGSPPVGSGAGLSCRTPLNSLVSPARWLLSDDARHVTGQLIAASAWDEKLPGLQAARRASRSLAASPPALALAFPLHEPPLETPRDCILPLPMAIGGSSAARLVHLPDPANRRKKPV